jgi:hypothetical protein
MPSSVSVGDDADADAGSCWWMTNKMDKEVASDDDAIVTAVASVGVDDDDDDDDKSNRPSFQ